MARNVVRAGVGVTFATIAPAGFEILSALSGLAKVLRKDVTITSGTDSHTLPDPHSSGEAYDISIWSWAPGEVSQGVQFLRTTLGEAFTVLYEVNKLPTDPLLAPLAYVNPKATGPHMHIQRRKGTVYP